MSRLAWSLLASMLPIAAALADDPASASGPRAIAAAPPAPPAQEASPAPAAAAEPAPAPAPLHPPLQLDGRLASSPVAVVAEFHRAMEENFPAGLLAQLDPDVVVYEQGFAERSREEYAAVHLGNDIAFAAATRREVVKSDAWESGDSAWVLTQFRTDGQFEGRAIALESTETMVLKRRDGYWKITHIHWSGHPRPEAPPPP